MLLKKKSIQKFTFKEDIPSQEQYELFKTMLTQKKDRKMEELLNTIFGK